VVQQKVLRGEESSLVGEWSCNLVPRNRFEVSIVGWRRAETIELRTRAEGQGIHISSMLAVLMTISTKNRVKKGDMKFNGVMPKMKVDPERYVSVPLLLSSAMMPGVESRGMYADPFG
jgi:hypothetical protein